MFEEVLTYGAVVGAATYAAWRLLPGALRLALIKHAATLAQRCGLSEPAAEAIRGRAASSTRNTCGGCSGCAGKQTPASHVMTIKKNVKGN
jgi:hypothetical protein